jgi:DNA-binding NarL/FixJ family response regulator
MNGLRILVADDHDVVHRGLKRLLGSHPDWSVCADVHTGREAVEKAGELRPDIVVMDITMPEAEGVEAARKILKVSPNTDILVLLHHCDQRIHYVSNAEIRGYEARTDSDQTVTNAVEALADHKPLPPVSSTGLLLNKVRNKVACRSVADAIGIPLTSREREILHLLSDGRTNKDIASTLGISVKTAETHRANIMRKLELHSVSELVRYAVRNHMIEP